jgi:hypothetical protein
VLYSSFTNKHRGGEEEHTRKNKQEKEKERKRKGRSKQWMNEYDCDNLQMSHSYQLSSPH